MMFPRLAALLLAAFCLGGQAAADVPVAQLTARVTDLTATLSAEQKAQLENKLATFEQKKGSQIAVLILPTTQPESIEQYAVRVFETWKLGRAKEMDGVLLIVAKNDRRMRIEVGYGLEGALPDAHAKRIIAEIMTPFFKAGDFYRGIDAGVDAIVAAIDKEALPAPDQRRQGSASPGADYQALLMILFFGVVVLSRIGTNIMGRFTGSLAAAAGTGFLAWVVGGLLFGAIGIALFTFFASLLLGSSGGRYSSFSSIGGWGGGGGFGGGDGGGGFSGGGGSSGGGGASGSW
jgi:uncharacterized protein